MTFKRFWKILRLTIAAWQAHNVSRLAAALAYYAVFSLAPVLLLVIALTGLFLGQEAAQGEIFAQIRELVGNDAARAVEVMVENVGDRGSSISATLISLALLIFGASGLFVHLKDSLNIIWQTEESVQKGGIKTAVLNRVLSFSMIPLIGSLLLLSLMTSALLASIPESLLLGAWGDWFPLIRVLNSLISVGIVVLFFALIYKILPDVDIAWVDVWVGALATTVLFIVGQSAIGFYLSNSAIGSTYGAAGSFVVLLLWIYYSAQILFLGAEFTQVYANHYGSRIRSSQDVTQGR